MVDRYQQSLRVYAIGAAITCCVHVSAAPAFGAEISDSKLTAACSLRLGNVFRQRFLNANNSERVRLKQLLGPIEQQEESCRSRLIMSLSERSAADAKSTAAAKADLQKRLAETEDYPEIPSTLGRIDPSEVSDVFIGRGIRYADPISAWRTRINGNVVTLVTSAVISNTPAVQGVLYVSVDLPSDVAKSTSRAPRVFEKIIPSPAPTGPLYVVSETGVTFFLSSSGGKAYRFDFKKMNFD